MHSKAIAFRVTILIAFCLWSVDPDAQIVDHPAYRDGRLRPILDYIASAWETLTRSTASCEGIADSKVTEEPVLYLPEGFPAPDGLATNLHSCGYSVRHLPMVLSRLGQVKANGIQPAGLLYLESPYVVPGGRFNEMYGWDSYFIIRGLLRSGKIDLAKGMVDNFFFEIEHYGGVLNANRTYYLTRSQPPFLSSMILAVYEEEKARGRTDREWLQKAYRLAERDYEMWTHEPHLAENTGLSRYYDLGDGPVIEGLHDEIGYYHDVLAYFIKHDSGSKYLDLSPHADSLSHPEYKLEVCQDDPSLDDAKCTHQVALSSEYYKGDRSMRESGFDITFRFGPYGAETHHYAPACLNSLLYKTETDLEKMSAWLGDKHAAQLWHGRAEKRKKIVQSLLWSEPRGMFFDYDFKTRKLSTYDYATTFYPLWVGLASEAQAKAVVGNLGRFEQKGGLAMSTQETGVQWDYPYGWAPIQLIAIEGLRRYGYDRDADRISYEFLSMVLDNFERDHNIREKYNVVSDRSNIQVSEGYRDNVIGFGWTNAVFLELLSRLPEKEVKELAESEADPR
jgi:alpha,alpha-trehalase